MVALTIGYVSSFSEKDSRCSSHHPLCSNSAAFSFVTNVAQTNAAQTNVAQTDQCRANQTKFRKF